MDKNRANMIALLLVLAIAMFIVVCLIVNDSKKINNAMEDYNLIQNI